MNILLTSYYPLPSLGGIWTFVTQLKNELEQNGHTIDILSFNPDTKNYRIIGKQEMDRKRFRKEISDFKRQLPNNEQLNAWIANVEMNRFILGLSSEHYGLHRYDVIHAQDVLAATVLKKRKPASVPLVTSAHGYLSGAIFYTLKTRYPHKSDYELKHLAEYKFHNEIEKEGYDASYLIHTQSKWMFHKLKNEFSVPEEKLRVFSYALDINQLVTKSKGTPSVLRPKDKNVILFAGRLVYLKGIHHLIDALGLLKKKRNDWVCWLLGEGELKHKLEQQCRNLGIENDVVFLGTKTNVIDYLRQADLFVLPSLQDTQPHSVMEAQVAGVPVIVSNAAGLPEMVINGKTGFIAQVGNSEQLFKQIHYLLDHPTVRNRLANLAKEWGKKQWSLTKLANNTLSMYHEAINIGKQ